MRARQLLALLVALLAPSLASAQADPNMSFFVTSQGNGASAGNYGGLAGADSRCQDLATQAGAGSRTWRAYLSTTLDEGDFGQLIHARNRIGVGPWYNYFGDLVASDVDSLHEDGADPALLFTELGAVVPDREHDILTGSDENGFALTSFPGNPGAPGPNCFNWTDASANSWAWVGHVDADPGDSWNSVHGSACDQAGLEVTWGSGRLYCFAADPGDPLPPANDLCDGAEALSPSGPFPLSDVLDTSQASGQEGDPASGCGDGGEGATVWYSYTPVVDGTLILATDESDYASMISVWLAAEGCGTLVSEQACDDDASTGTAPEVVMDVAAGTSYLIAVADLAGDVGGVLRLSVDFEGEGGGSNDAMSFFVTSEGSGEAGGDYGGLSGADDRCQTLATVAGAGAGEWRAYLSSAPIEGFGGELVHARDRIGAGPWFDFTGALVANDVAGLHADGLSLASAIDEYGDPVPGAEHDILTGSNPDGTARQEFPDNPDAPSPTCFNWTEGVANAWTWVGHSDDSGQWSSSHATTCDPAGLEATAGSGRLYCFRAVPEPDQVLLAGATLLAIASLRLLAADRAPRRGRRDRA